MFILVTGGSGSGKSEFAENIAMKLGGKMLYVATMKPYDDECLNVSNVTEKCVTAKDLERLNVILIYPK